MKLSAFEQGYAAFLRGESERRNPFDAETASFSRGRWQMGWDAAKRKSLERVV